MFIFVNYYMMLLEDVGFDVDYVDFKDVVKKNLKNVWLLFY